MCNQIIHTLEIEGLSGENVLALFGESGPDFGLKIKLTDDIEVENRTSVGFGVDEYTVFTIFVSVASSITTSILANAIYDWIKGRVLKAHVNHISVSIDVESIKSAIEEACKDDSQK